MGPLYLVLTSSHCNDLFWGCLWNAFDPRGSANSFLFLVGVPEKSGLIYKTHYVIIVPDETWIRSFFGCLPLFMKAIFDKEKGLYF